MSLVFLITVFLLFGSPGQWNCTVQAAERYTDNGDGTVNHADTGLMWQKADDGLKKSWENACQYCDNLELAGYDDWRAPRIDELRTIIDYEVGAPALNSIFKVQYPMSDYWSSSTRVYNREDFGNPQDYGWFVNFSGGQVNFRDQILYAYTRCARGGPNWPFDPISNLVINDNNTVADNLTGLIWQRSDDGKTRTWNEAFSYCEALSLDGYDDWRMPKIEELQTIIDYTKYDPTISSEVFAIRDSNNMYYWSDTAGVNYKDTAWIANFYSGTVGWHYKSRDFMVVRCVNSDNSQDDDPITVDPDSEHIDGVTNGDYIHFGGRDWIMLDNLIGYAILKDYAGTEKIAFDDGGGQTWDYNGKTASSKLYLNTIFFNSLGDDKDFIDNNGEWVIEAGVNDPEYTWNGKVGMLTKTEFEYYNENGPNLTGTSVRAISFPIEDPNFFGQWWLLTPGVGYSAGDSIVRFIADYNRISATDSRATHQGFIRPTLHLKSDLYVKNGDGTSENPKIITDDPNQNEPPMADAGPDQTVELESLDGTEVTLDGSESTDTDSSPETNDDIVDFDWYKDDILLGNGESFVYTFPLGTHTVTLIVTDSSGESDEDEVVITIEDTTPPEVTISASPGTLWPPNGKMKDVLIQGEATDISGEVSLVLLVEDEYGEINLSLSDFDEIIQLEAWRKGRDKDGRTYTINVIATDSSGNGAFASTLVVVPHDQGKKK